MDIQRFEFTNYDVEVQFGDDTYMLDCSTDTGEFLRTAAAELSELVDDFENGKKSIDDAVSYGLAVIDRLLGAGASEKIFAGRKKRMADIIDICMFLARAVAKFQAEQRKAPGGRAKA